MRDGWTRELNNLLFGCAPHDTLNCGHAHADALSFELAVNGRTMLVAPGNYTHTGSKELRDLFRGSRAHKTVTFGGEPCPVPDTALSWKTSVGWALEKWNIADCVDYVSGKHDNFGRLADRVSVEWSILFLKREYFIVRDQTRASAFIVSVKGTG